MINNGAPFPLSLDRVSVSLNGTEIIKNISWDIPGGSKWMITGPNGSGKTTLLKAILGLVTYQKGRIHLGTWEVGSPEWSKHRRNMSYVGQLAVQSPFPITTTEVVSLGLPFHLNRHHRKQAIFQSMELVGAVHLLNKQFNLLSGGEKQRVSIARCLAQNPGILILDEPSSSLDPDAKNDLIVLLDRLNQSGQQTILLVSHEPGYLSRSHWQFLRLEHGQQVRSV